MSHLKDLAKGTLAIVGALACVPFAMSPAHALTKLNFSLEVTETNSPNFNVGDTFSDLFIEFDETATPTPSGDVPVTAFSGVNFGPISFDLADFRSLNWEITTPENNLVGFSNILVPSFADLAFDSNGPSITLRTRGQNPATTSFKFTETSRETTSPESVPEPASLLGLAAISVAAAGGALKRKATA